LWPKGTATEGQWHSKRRSIAMEILIMIAFLYMLPWIVAMARTHHNRGAIFLLNLFLGWTLIGWLAALIWAATEQRWKAERRMEHMLRPREEVIPAPRDLDLTALGEKEAARLTKLRADLAR
jgi:hypothetical protein